MPSKISILIFWLPPLPPHLLRFRFWCFYMVEEKARQFFCGKATFSGFCSWLLSAVLLFVKISAPILMYDIFFEIIWLSISSYFCCTLMKARMLLSRLRKIRLWLFCNSTEKTKYLSTFIWKPRNLVSGSFHACCLQKLQKATSTINHNWRNGW